MPPRQAGGQPLHPIYSQVLECLDHLDAHREALAEAFQKAQETTHWDRIVADAGTAYRAT